MILILLQPMVEAIAESSLPSAWAGLDLETFSHAKAMREYQQAALRNARNILWKYYEAFVDYQPGEPLVTNERRKTLLWPCYGDNGVDARTMHLTVDRLWTEAFRATPRALWPQGRSYEPFINRTSFWIATGSGKTLGIVKLIAMLWTLIQSRAAKYHLTAFCS